MIEPCEAHFDGLIANRFHNMTVPGDGFGFAIVYETEEIAIAVALGRSETGGIEVRKKGGPFGEPYVVSGTRLVSRVEFERSVESLGGHFRKPGVIAAPDLLGGESYFVKWCGEHECTCLLLCNPRETGDPDVSEFVARLDRVLGKSEDTLPDWAKQGCKRDWYGWASVYPFENAAFTHLFGFTGRPGEVTTGLQNNLNRWYDAEVGSWLNEDLIGFEGGDANLYRYCGNDPVNGTDPNS